MRTFAWTLLVCPIACVSPVGEMSETETETETDTDASSSSGDASTSPTTTATTATTSASTTMATTASTSATTDMTTADPDTSTTDEPTTDEPSTGECPPGDLGCPCDVGSECNDDLFCVDGTCQDAPACDEPEGEPNDDEAGAVMLDEVTCSGFTPAETTTGGLDGAESDWFTFHAASAIACFENPSVSLEADTDLAVCIFASCDDGETQLGCSGGADESQSPDGLDGCCNQNEVGLNNFGCGAAQRNGTIYVRITSIEDACIPYELSWSY